MSFSLTTTFRNSVAMGVTIAAFGTLFMEFQMCHGYIQKGNIQSGNPDIEELKTANLELF